MDKEFIQNLIKNQISESDQLEYKELNFNNTKKDDTNFDIEYSKI